MTTDLTVSKCPLSPAETERLSVGSSPPFGLNGSYTSVLDSALPPVISPGWEPFDRKSPNSTKTHKIRTFRQHALIHRWFDQFWTWLDPSFGSPFWEAKVGLLGRSLNKTDPTSMVPN